MCPLMYFAMYLSMVCGMLVCVSLSINECMFTGSNASLMSNATAIVGVMGLFFGRKNFIQKKNPTKKYRVYIIYMIMTKFRRYKIINRMK